MSRKKILLFLILITTSLSIVLYQKENSSTFDINNPNIENILNISGYSENKTKSEKISKMRKLLSNLDLSEQNTINEYYNSAPHFYFDIFDLFASFLYDMKLTDLLDNEEIETCFFDGIIENLLKSELINIYIDGSGKSVNDFGNEFVCNYNIRRNVSYLTVHFYLGTNDFRKEKEEFFGQYYFYMGLCLPKKCMNAAKILVVNEKVLDICHRVGISNLKLYVSEDVVEKSNNISQFYNVIISIYIFFNFFKLLIGIFRVIFMNKGYEGYFVERERKLNEEVLSLGLNVNNNVEKEPTGNKLEEDNIIHKINTNTSIQSLDNNDSNISYTYDDYISENNIAKGENLYNPFSDKEKYFPVLLKIMKMLDLFDNLNILSSNSNKYYNSNRIKNLYFIRFLLMIMTIVNQIMNTQNDLPSKNYYNFEFYSSFYFIFIKICVNASTFWITLDGVMFGYKIISYLKKEIKLVPRNSYVKYITFLKFLLLIIPKFFIFLFAFIILHLNASKLTFELCKKNNKVFSNYLYYNDTVQQATYSLRTTNNFKDFLKNFIPFKLNYIDFIEDIKIEMTNQTGTNYTSDVSGFELPSPFLKNTDLFVNVYFDEFYLMILMINITYISYRLRNKIFDFSILIINFILYILPAFETLNPFRGNIEEKNYTLKYVLGQNYSEKYTHYFINFFYFGFLIGIMKFYHDENIYNMKKKKKYFSNIKLPFDFCKIIVNNLNKINIHFKRAILLICIFFLLFISSSFYFLEAKNFSHEKLEFVKISGVVKFLFFYEKNLSGIFFFIFLIFFVIYPKNSFLMQISNSSFFIIMERISFAFYNCFAYSIYTQFCVFIMSMQMNYGNLIANTFGMFFIIFIFSLFNAALLELPIRQLVKHFMNRNLESNFINYINSNFSNSTPSDEKPSPDNSIKKE